MKLREKMPYKFIVKHVKDEPHLYETSTFYDKEASRVRRAPDEYIVLSNVKTGLKYEGKFKA